MKNVFVDTNILVYAAEERTPVARKTTISRELLLLPRIHFSVQVLNEFVAIARNPKKLALPRDRELRWLNGWLLRPVLPISVETFLSAQAMHLRYQLSHWDSLIVSSAIEAGCHRVYSEDLQHGQIIEGLEIINPFQEE